MSLYGLDIIESDGKRYLSEINGINSDMSDFEQIYGDDRVKQKVYGMLRDKHGKLTMNDGTFTRNKYKREHLFMFALGYAIYKTPLINRFFLPTSRVLLSPDAEIDWMKEKTHLGKIPFDEFERYKGQESTVINIANEKLKHPMVNDFLSQEITLNKFLQYMLLKDSEISENVIPSMLVGLGTADNNSLVKMASSGGFVRKPILGSQGRGIKFLTQEEAILFYQNTGGPIYGNPRSRFFGTKTDVETYLEDLVAEKDWTFEYGLSLLQPFVESKTKIDGEEKYSFLRAIVCNGEFVDAYRSTSKNKGVNYSEDEKTIPFNYDSNFANFCQNVVKVFEEKSQELDINSFRENLYMEYFSGIERPIRRWKETFDFGAANIALDILFRLQKDK
ncbi:MAG: hypothetical protein AABX93_01675 [Nanoarchaeota archaeon]